MNEHDKLYSIELRTNKLTTFIELVHKAENQQTTKISIDS